ncbi:hypothetical protein Patl1_03151 [Pistacia atlantica]|uniref:Uncharacterized protein n=1 Tax=Pistacia atlantica TaxID=434234 RepID=A0ACC1CB77_9ROSI|nr:hypothetical protein Patl1_03151 [Pistacia atlantica]
MRAKHSHFSMAIQPITSSLYSHFHLQLLPHSPTVSPFTFLPGHLHSKFHKAPRKSPRIICKSNEDDYLIDAPVSVGDGLTSVEMKAHPVSGSGEKAKDPVFGLTMGAASRASADVFRWFCLESGSADNHSVLLIHGFPSQAYSYRKVLPTLAKNCHAIAFDWLGFGFSEKPQPRYGFDYTVDEYVASLESVINEISSDKSRLLSFFDCQSSDLAANFIYYV